MAKRAGREGTANSLPVSMSTAQKLPVLSSRDEVLPGFD